MYLVRKRFYGDIVLYSSKCPYCGYTGYIGGSNTCVDCGASLPEIADKVKMSRESESWKRLKPSIKEQQKLLSIQDNKCAWCGCGFNEEITNEKTGKTIVPSIHYDHIVPFSYGGNLASNWAATCNTCNQIKHNKYFSTYEDLYEYIRDKRTLRGWPTKIF